MYVSCKCGRTSVDAGDGLYSRVNSHDGIPLPKYYKQSKKGSLVMTSKQSKKLVNAYKKSTKTT